MDQPFLHPIAGEDFVANPFAGMPSREGRIVGSESVSAGPASRFDLSALLGGPADIAAMQRDLEVMSGPLSLDTATTPPATPDDAMTQMDPTAAPGRTPTGDELAGLIAMVLEHLGEHLADRNAFCQRLGNTLAAFLAAGTATGGTGGEGSAR